MKDIYRSFENFENERYLLRTVTMADAPALLQQLQREKRKLEAVRSEVHQSQPRLVRLWECLQASRSMK